jgi:hypothetical protein
MRQIEINIMKTNNADLLATEKSSEVLPDLEKLRPRGRQVIETKKEGRIGRRKGREKRRSHHEDCSSHHGPPHCALF